MAAAAERRAWLRAVTHPAFALPYWLAVWYVVHIPAVYGYAPRPPLGARHRAPAVRDRRPRLLVAGARPRPHAPMAKLVYLAAAFFLAAPVALLIALASSTIYHYYDTTPHLFGLSARDDQQLGGILMAVEQSLILFVVFSLAFYAAARRRRAPARPAGSSRFRLMDRITAACVQFSASRDKAENIAPHGAAGRGGRRPRRRAWCCCPRSGTPSPTAASCARTPSRSRTAARPSTRWPTGRATSQLDLIGGSIAIADGDRVGNVSIAFDPRRRARRRLHQDPPVRRRRGRHQLPRVRRHRARRRAGDRRASSGLPVGLTVCYDLRFPELYRAARR